nr:hypothetical protein [Tanacetum cinerariifolium]
MILELVEHGLLIWPTVEENGVTRTKKYAELSAAEKIQADCDMKATNIILQEWSKFVTDVKLVRDLHTTNFDQLRAYLEQHKLHANEVRLLRAHNQDPLAFMANQQMTPRDDPIACLNKAMTFLTAVASSRQGLLNLTTVKTEDFDTYNFDCDHISNAKAVLMANISNYGSDVISEEKANKEQNNKPVTIELERYKERVKTFEQRLNIDLSSREKMIDSQMDDMIKEKIALKEKADSLKQNTSKQIKEKECLLQTLTVFKSESKEKKDKYMENEIDLEKKIKKLDNILFKVGQSAQTVHMLTKPQTFYDNIHKQALGYQNPFRLKKSQRIKPTLYDVYRVGGRFVVKGGFNLRDWHGFGR